MKLEWGKVKVVLSIGLVEFLLEELFLKLEVVGLGKKLLDRVSSPQPHARTNTGDEVIVIVVVGMAGIMLIISALRLAQVKLPAQSEFITATSSPRLGSLTSPSLTRPPAAMPAPAHLLDMDSRDEGKAPALVLAEEERRVEGLEDVTRGMQGLDLGKEEARA